MFKRQKAPPAAPAAQVAVRLSAAELEALNEDLHDQLMTVRQDLQRTRAKLKDMDDTMDEFISMASHQLRTPLTSVKGYLSMVLEGDTGPLNDQQRKMLNQAFVSSQRMVYLISDLLNISRIKTGKFILEPLPTNLADVVQDEIEQVAGEAQARGLTLTYDKPASFPTLMLDETKIRQVIMNFIDNALHYTPTGGQVTVALKDTGPAVEFTVTDNGLGVPKAEQKQLFTKFFRADNARQARPDGTGIGLFMAKKVVIAHGGTLIFSSQESQGSTFGFSFAKTRPVA